MSLISKAFAPDRIIGRDRSRAASLVPTGDLEGPADGLLLGIRRSPSGDFPSERTRSAPTLFGRMGTSYRQEVHYCIVLCEVNSELNFPKIEEFLAPFRLTRAEAEPGSVKMAQTLASNLRAAYFKRSDVMLVVEPDANHSSESWARRLPALSLFCLVALERGSDILPNVSPEGNDRRITK